MRFFPSSLALLTALVTGATAADDQVDDPFFNPIVVTASRIAVPRDELVPPIIVIDRDEIARSGAADLGALLRFHAGLDIGRNGGPGQTTSVFIRGAESNHTLVLVNGVRMNPGTIGGAAIQNINPDLVERIEIVKGPRSSLYGSEAIGGVINVITRQFDGAAAEAAVGAGHYDTYSATLAGGMQNQRSGFNAGAAFTDSEGFPTLAGNDIDRGHDNLSVNLDGWVDISAGELSARAWRADGTTEYSDFFGAPQSQDFMNQALEVSLTSDITSAWRSNLSLSDIIDDIEQIDSADFAKTRRVALDWQNTVSAFANHEIVAGLYGYREDTDASVFGSGFDEDTDLKAVYLEDNASWDRHRYSLAARYTDHETFGGETTWHADYGYLFSDELMLTVAAGTGFRAPDSSDRFGFGGNPALEPESSRNFEAGLRYRFLSGQRIAISAFSQEIDDLIIYDFDPVTFDGINRNLAETRTRGIEIVYDYRNGPWRLHSEAIFQNPEDRASGDALPRRARRSLTANLVRSLGRGELGLDVLASGERKDSSFSDEFNAGYVLANLSGRWPLGERIEIQGKIENLLDADYQTASGFNMAGRGLYLRLTYRNN